MKIDETKIKKEKSTLTKKDYDDLILEYEKDQKIELTIEDLLKTNPKWTQRERNFNIKFYRLVLGSLINKQAN